MTGAARCVISTRYSTCFGGRHAASLSTTPISESHHVGWWYKAYMLMEPIAKTLHLWIGGFAKHCKWLRGFTRGTPVLRCNVTSYHLPCQLSRGMYGHIWQNIHPITHTRPTVKNPTISAFQPVQRKPQNPYITTFFPEQCGPQSLDPAALTLENYNPNCMARRSTHAHRPLYWHAHHLGDADRSSITNSNLEHTI
jgi:hypothetical protein